MVIGVTGNLGVGKTTVAGMFQRLGARVINADRIAHTLIKPDRPAYRKIIKAFGKGVLSGIYISRKRLSKEAFSDRQKLNTLNRITHPEILSVIKEKIRKQSGRQVLVIDAPLLIESGLLPWVDKLVVVKLRPDIQMQRLRRSGLTAGQIKKRLSFQLLQAQKIHCADFVIDNKGTKRHTEKKVRDIWGRINQLRRF